MRMIGVGERALELSGRARLGMKPCTNEL